VIPGQPRHAPQTFSSAAEQGLHLWHNGSLVSNADASAVMDANMTVGDQVMRCGAGDLGHHQIAGPDRAVDRDREAHEPAVARQTYARSTRGFRWPNTKCLRTACAGPDVDRFEFTAVVRTIRRMPGFVLDGG